MKISDFAGSFSWQSESLPGRVVDSNADFLLVSSLAFFAASLAFAETIHFEIIAFAV